MKKLNYGKIAKLVEQSKKQDSNAFAELYQMLYQKIYFFALSLTKNESMAEDAVQESFMKALSSLDSLKDSGLFVAWLNKITYNVCMAAVSNKTAQPMNELYDDMIASIEDERDDNDPIACAVANERSKFVLEEIQKLSLPLRTAVVMHYYNNLKLQEIAVVLECPVGTVKSRLNAAKKQLKRSISENKQKGESMLNYFGGISISTALADAGRNISMDPSAAAHILTETLSQNGMSSAVNFSPQPDCSSAGGSLQHFAPQLAAAGATVAAVTAASVMLLNPAPPEILEVSFEDELTREPVEVEIQVNEDADVLRVTLEGNGNTILAAETGDGSFVATIPENGEYVIVAEDEDGEKDSYNLSITCIDKKGPTLSNYTDETDRVVLYMKDEEAGVDFSSAYAILSDGTRVSPLETDEAAGKITFEKEGERENVFKVYVEDKLGNRSEFEVITTFSHIETEEVPAEE